MSTLLDLAKRLEAKAKTYDDIANTKKIEVATAILTELTQVTPVDTSTAVSNWQVGIGSPVDAEIDAHIPGKKGSTRTQSAAEALSIGKRALATVKPGQPVYISNLVRYIKYLNEGWSKQAPAGFVETAILIGRRVIERNSGK